MDSTLEPQLGCLDDDGVSRGERWDGVPEPADAAPEPVVPEPEPEETPPPDGFWARRKRR